MPKDYPEDKEQTTDNPSSSDQDEPSDFFDDNVISDDFFADMGHLIKELIVFWGNIFGKTFELFLKVFLPD